MRNKRKAPKPIRRSTDIVIPSEIVVTCTIFITYMSLIWLVMELALK